MNEPEGVMLKGWLACQANKVSLHANQEMGVPQVRYLLKF